MRYELDKKITVHQRTVYSVFDFMRDIGGVFFLVATFCSVFASLFNFNKHENKLVAQLYKRPKMGQDKGTLLNAENQSVTLEMFQACQCGKTKCCGRGDRTDRWFDLGRRTLAHEVNVKKIVRSIR